MVAPKSWSFEPTGRLVHLRWAVAEIAISVETPSAGLVAAERALKIFSQRAAGLLEAMNTDDDALSDACYAAELAISEARTSLAQVSLLRAERARALHQSRAKLHGALIVMAEALAKQGASSPEPRHLDPRELGNLLSLRQMFSAFRGGLISSGEHRGRLAWALEVARAELSVLLATPALYELPVASQTVVRDLSRRISEWLGKEAEPVLGRSLYREATMVPALVGELSSHPLLLEHDEQSLSELAALLAHESASALLEGQVLAHLCALRGLDYELDRLELSLIYGAAGTLGSLSMRVSDLRSRLSRPVRAAGSWS
jgi:hypothetical protein